MKKELEQAQVTIAELKEYAKNSDEVTDAHINCILGLRKELEGYKKVLDKLEQGLKDAGNNIFREQQNRFGINTAINLLKELKSKHIK